MWFPQVMRDDGIEFLAECEQRRVGQPQPTRVVLEEGFTCNRRIIILILVSQGA